MRNTGEMGSRHPPGRPETGRFMSIFSGKLKLFSIRSKFTRLAALLVLAGLLTALLSAATSSGLRTGTVSVGDGYALNVRSGPGTSYSVLGQLDNGVSVVITGEESGWYQIQYNSSAGYVSTSLIAGVTDVQSTPTTDATIYTYGTVINASSLNVRSGPGTGYSILTYLDSSETMTILETVTGTDGNPWYYISTEFGYQGYVSASYVQTETKTIAWDAEFEAYLSEQGFPDSYKDRLRILHSEYPSWNFVAVDTGLDWSTVVSAETRLGYSLVSGSSPDSWKSTADGAYNWTTGTWYELDSGGWVQASDEIVSYYLDPRNFLSSQSVFQFLYQGCDASLSVEAAESGLRSMLLGTFLYPNASSETVTYTNGGNVDYIQLLASAGKTYGVNPYVLAAVILQEQGTGNSGSISGANTTFPGYYNYFNIGAYSTAKYDAIDNGLYYASGYGTGATSYGRPWNTRESSILGGAQYYAENYLESGQNTQYFKKFNVAASASDDLYTNQYMTNIQGANSEGCSLAGAYTASMRQVGLTFYIPVYRNMPDSTSMPLTTGSPNSKLSSLTVGSYSLTPAFSRDTLSYSLVVENAVASVSVSASAYDSTAAVTVNGTAVAAGGAVTVPLAVGNNTVAVVVTAQSGATREYDVTIARKADSSAVSFTSSKYTLSASGQLTGVSPSTTAAGLLSGCTCGGGATASVVSASGTLKTGDTAVGTGDAVNVYAADGSLSMTYTIIIRGDVNGDGKISISDLIKVRNDILQTATLSGAYGTAGDVNRDGKISISDLIKIRNQILGTASIAQ